MNPVDFSHVHEAMGDRYLDLCAKHGIRCPPPVLWVTQPIPHGQTAAFICFEGEHEEFVTGFPRDMLVHEVVRTVLACVGSGN